MLVDWFTVAAQVVNFVILLLLLRRFLYRPIVEAMRERERKVAERLQSAADERVQAEAERERYQSLTEELRQAFAAKKRAAEEEVDLWRAGAIERARQEVEGVAQAWRKSLEQEKESFGADLRRFAVRQTCAVAGKALRDLADVGLEERLLERFLTLVEEGSLDLGQLEGDAAEGLVVSSAFELGDGARQRLRRALEARLGTELTLRFEVRPELEAGVELAGARGYHAAWNLQRYLQALEDDLDDQLQRHRAA